MDAPHSRAAQNSVDEKLADRSDLDQATFSVREFLVQREALLVHFSTPMSNHRELFFPEDLRTAARLKGNALCFSTIQAGDAGPHQDPNVDPADANAGGSIGIIVDIASNDCVTAVSAGDGGAFEDPDTGETTSVGLPPSAESCARSIDERKTCNEWLVRNYRPIAIFAFGPIRVSQDVYASHPGQLSRYCRAYVNHV
jgi:hypothetical protein